MKRSLLGAIAGSAAVSLILAMTNPYLAPLPLAGLVLVYIIYPYIEHITYLRGLDNGYMDFITLLSSMENAGIHVDKLLRELGRGNIYINNSYTLLGKQYVVFEELTGSVPSAITRLARTVEGSRVARLLTGYVDSITTSGDTRSYIDTVLREEHSRLQGALQNSLTLIDNMYESFLIVLLAAILFTLMPGIGRVTAVLPLIISVAGAAAYMVAGFVTSKICLGEPLFSGAVVYSLLLILALAAMAMPFMLFMLLALVATLPLSIMHAVYYRAVSRIDSTAINMLEELYSEASKGFDIESSIAKLVSMGKYLSILGPINRLAEIGVGLREAVENISYPPLATRIIRSIVLPIGYISVHDRYLASVLSATRLMLEARRSVVERTRLYIGYAFSLPLVSYIVLRSLPMGTHCPLDGVFSSIMIASIAAALVANRLRKGCGLCDVKIIASSLAINIILYLIP